MWKVLRAWGVHSNDFQMDFCSTDVGEIRPSLFQSPLLLHCRHARSVMVGALDFFRSFRLSADARFSSDERYRPMVPVSASGCAASAA